MDQGANDASAWKGSLPLETGTSRRRQGTGSPPRWTARAQSSGRCCAHRRRSQGSRPARPAEGGGGGSVGGGAGGGGVGTDAEDGRRRTSVPLTGPRHVVPE